jgi:MYXO-CTERM domain-containing protein
MFSQDDGATFATRQYGESLSVLHVQGGNPDMIWALSPHPESGDHAILRGAFSEATFTTVHRVRFFGGFAMDDDNGTVWVADEAGSLFRSDNDGDTFNALRSDLAIAWLVHRNDALWACTTGTNQQPSLMLSRDRGDNFEALVAFEAVSRLVECESAAMVPTVCAFAWAEWQADVLPRSTPDASVTSDASTDDDAGSSPPARKRGGCQVTVGHNAPLSGMAPTALLLAMLLGAWRKRGPYERDGRRTIDR